MHRGDRISWEKKAPAVCSSVLGGCSWWQRSRWGEKRQGDGTGGERGCRAGRAEEHGAQGRSVLLLIGRRRSCSCFGRLAPVPAPGGSARGKEHGSARGKEQGGATALEEELGDEEAGWCAQAGKKRHGR
jgi:hypothetical protein